MEKLQPQTYTRTHLQMNDGIKIRCALNTCEEKNNKTKQNKTWNLIA